MIVIKFCPVTLKRTGYLALFLQLPAKKLALDTL